MAVKARLAELAVNNVRFTGEWQAAKVFHHLAQSVAYSMTGYPVHKSALFKDSVGRLAWQLFAAKQRMTHDLAEPIPGAPAIPDSGSVTLAYQRLLTALDAFAQFQGELQPHFAYGALSPTEYAAAHAMHVYNHLELLIT